MLASARYSPLIQFCFVSLLASGLTLGYWSTCKQTVALFIILMAVMIKFYYVVLSKLYKFLSSIRPFLLGSPTLSQSSMEGHCKLTYRFNPIHMNYIKLKPENRNGDHAQNGECEREDTEED